MPTPEQLNKFWDDFKNLMKNSDAHIDVENPVDVARIRVVNIDGIDTTVTGFEAENVTAKFAFIDDENFDFSKASDEEFFAAQNPGKPSMEKLEWLYNASKEGRLCFTSLKETKLSHRQVVIDDNGNMSILNDMMHSTPEQQAASFASREPQPPRRPGLWTRILAFFGNKNAKRKMTIYQNRVEDFPGKMREWERQQQMNPTFVKQTHNQLYASLGYFQVPLDQEGRLRETRISNITTEAHMKSIGNKLIGKVNDVMTGIDNKFTDLAKNQASMTPEEKEKNIAGIFHCKSTLMQIKADLENKKLTETKFASYEKLLDPESPEYKGELDKIMQAPGFKKTVSAVTDDDLAKFADDPVAATNSLYEKCVNAAKEKVADAAENKPASVEKQAEEKNAAQAKKDDDGPILG